MLDQNKYRNCFNNLIDLEYITLKTIKNINM